MKRLQAAKTALLISLAVLLAGCGEESSFQKGFNESFDRSWKESFVKSCAAGVSGKVDAAMANTLCGCIMEYMDARLTRTEKMSASSAKADTLAKEGAEICIARISPEAAS